MTVTEALAAIRAKGMTAKHVDGEFAVTFTQVAARRATGLTGDGLKDWLTDQTYYTNDAEDAVNTAAKMALATF